MPTDHDVTARRITRTLFAAQGLASAGSTAMFPTIPIVGAHLSGHASWAGVSAMMYTLGAALSAYLWGSAMDRFGRRGALIAGMAVGIGGSALAGAAVVVGSFAAFLTGVALLGSAFAALNLSRFVAAEVHAPARRARAISTVVLGGTVGALFGPLIANSTARLAQHGSYDELVGPYGAMLVIFAVVAAVLFALLRPEPKDLALAISGLHAAVGPETGPAPPVTPARTISEILRLRPVLVAISAMGFGQLVMTMLMVITGLHMRNHHHSLTSITVVSSAHAVGMYAWSVVSGRLADAWGRGPVIMTGAGILIAAALTAPLSPQVLPLSVALFLLGMGWNFCYVAGSTLLADQLSPAERGRTQGFNDLLIGLASAAGSLGSGIVFALIGFGAMALVAAVAALAPLSLAAWWRWGARAVALAR